MTNSADDPTCRRLYLASLVVVSALEQGGASEAEIRQELIDLARQMDRSGST